MVAEGRKDLDRASLGIYLVSLLNYGQVKGSEKKTHFAEYFDPDNEKE